MGGGKMIPETFTRMYERLLFIAVTALPLIGIGYLSFFQNPDLVLHDHAFHEQAIAFAILQSAFISYVTWVCYRSSGEPLLRWLTLAFIGFTLVYLPHGLFTRMSTYHMAFFLVFGPVSRLVLAILMLGGLFVYGHLAHEGARRTDRQTWVAWIVGFILLDVLVGTMVLQGWISFQPLRLTVEWTALTLFLLGVVLLRIKRTPSSIMTLYAVSLALFAQSSFAFILGKPWNHMWWFAHFIFAVGFTVLSFGVVRAFHTTRSFSQVYNQEEIMRQLEEAKAYAEKVAEQLTEANHNLELLAATDPLTGLSNRRKFLEQSQNEFLRSERSAAPFAVLALDLDHFKQINDHYGHQAGDEVLKEFARVASSQLRPTDLIGRWGGEEFMILLTGVGKEEAGLIAERIREAIDKTALKYSAEEIRFSVSIGLAEFPADGRQQEELFKIADHRLYAAKAAGRNRVVSD